MSEALISWFMTNLGGKVGRERHYLYYFHGTDPGTSWRTFLLQVRRF